MLRSNRALIDITALASVTWIITAIIHEGLAHGLTCVSLGHKANVWTAFHFHCSNTLPTLFSGMVVFSADALAYFITFALCLMWWRKEFDTFRRYAAWMLTMFNGLSLFSALLFSITSNVANLAKTDILTRNYIHLISGVVLISICVTCYYLVIRLGALMISRMIGGPSAQINIRLFTLITWTSTVLISLLAALAANADWHLNITNALILAISSNIGLIFIPRFVMPSFDRSAPIFRGNEHLWDVAIVIVISFVLILGPGLRF